MRPRRLEINGFTAFRDPQEIDLTALDLFVITGPTGAGKTSLLDAMAFALYGKVPRMGGQGLGQLVSHGKAEARILLEFDIDRTPYRVSRRLPRTGSQHGKLERREGNAWEDAVDRAGIKPVNEAIQELVKLDFKSFCKAIVLPQGEFAQFLKGDPGERRKTLVSLLGLSAYEVMGRTARDRANTLRIRGEQTQTILAEQFGNATPEALAAAVAAAEAAAGEATAKAKMLAHAREIERDRLAAADQSDRAVALADRLTGVAEELRGEADRCQQVQGERAAADVAHDAAKAAAQHAAAGVPQAEATRNDVLRRTGDREQLARLLDAVDRKLELESRLAAAGSELSAARRQADEKTQAAAAASEAAAQALNRRDAAAAEEARAAEAAKRTASESDRLASRAEECRAAAAARAGAEADIGACEERAAAAAASLEAVTDARQATEAELEHIHRSDLVAALASGLGPGDPCPVCARPLESNPHVNHDVEAALQAAERAHADARARHNATQTELADAQAELRAARRRRDEALGRAADLLSEHGTADALAAAAEDAARAAAATAEDVQQAAKHHSAAAAEAEQAAIQATAAQKEQEAAAREVALRTAAIEQQEQDHEQAVALLRDRFGEPIPDDAHAQLEAARQELAAAEDELDTARQREGAARAHHAETVEQQRVLGEELASLDQRLTQLRTRAEGLLDDVRALVDAPAIAALPDPAEARDVRASELAQWCGGAAAVLREHGWVCGAAAAEAASSLVALAGELGRDVENADQALAAVADAEVSARETRATLDERRGQLAAQVERRRELEATVAKDAGQIAVLQVLATELRADHFIDFVIQETLDVLAVRASEELLRISDGRYSLVADRGEFSVIDHVNADERRSVRTLSGGETFMASLSLALALSKHVTELAGEGLGSRLEAVFIDEGFGSLDPETLEEVIDALERLREDDLLIGVISHVPTLAERIRDGLQVHKDGNRSFVSAVA